MHRNTFVDAPRLLDRTLALRSDPRVRIAGQLAGTEGYLEATAGGLLAGVQRGRFVSRASPRSSCPGTTAFGALLALGDRPRHGADYQPMHVNFGSLSTVAGAGARQARAVRRVLPARDRRLLAWLAENPSAVPVPTR